MRDVDCDFRLMRRRIFDVVRLEKDSGVICLEMMKKFQDAGFRVEYVEERWGRRLAAAWLDGVRLIDNVAIRED